MQTNSSVIENYGVLAELVYQNKYLDHSASDVIDSRLTSTYKVKNVSTSYHYDSGF